MKVFLALKAHTNKTCCLLAAHGATLLFWLQRSHHSKDEFVGLTGRKILLLRKEVSHLRKPEGHMFTEWKKNSLASLVKISESGTLLHSIVLFTVIFSCNGHSTRLRRSRHKIILILACCLSHTYFFCQTWFTTNQRCHMRSGKGRRLLAFPPFPFHRAQHKEWHSFFSTDYTKLACYYSSTTEHMLNFLCIRNIPGLSNTAYRIFSHTKTKRNHVSCPTDVCCSRYVFNHRRTNLINWEFSLCISSCCLWCLQWHCISVGFLPNSSDLEKRQNECTQKSLLFPSLVFHWFRNRVN